MIVDKEVKCPKNYLTLNVFTPICDSGRNGRQNKGGGAKNYQAFISGKKPNPEPASVPKVRPIS